MSGRKSSATPEREFIEALKRGGRTKQELWNVIKDNLPESSSHKYDAVRKRCDGYLQKYKELGLVMERNGKFYWYIYPNLSREKKQLKKHTKQLIPGLQLLLGSGTLRDSRTRKVIESYDSEDIDLIVSCAEDHLRTYPDIDTTMHSIRSEQNQAQALREKFESELMISIQSKFGDPTRESDMRMRIDHVCNAIPVSNNSEEMSTSYNEPTQVRFLLVPQAREKYYFVQTEKNKPFFLQLRKSILRAEENVRNLYLHFKTQVRSLILRLKSDEDIIGSCPLCPQEYHPQDI